MLNYSKQSHQVNVETKLEGLQSYTVLVHLFSHEVISRYKLAMTPIQLLYKINREGAVDKRGWALTQWWAVIRKQNHRSCLRSYLPSVEPVFAGITLDHKLRGVVGLPTEAVDLLVLLFGHLQAVQARPTKSGRKLIGSKVNMGVSGRPITTTLLQDLPSAVYLLL